MNMKGSRSLSVFLIGLCQWLLLVTPALAHPASGIVVDDQGRIYFLFDSLYRIEPSGKLSVVQRNTGGHWLALDARGAFANATPKIYKRGTPEGAIPALIYGDGAPLVIGLDGNLYYGTNGSQEESFPAGALTVARMSPHAELVCSFAQADSRQFERRHHWIDLRAGWFDLRGHLEGNRKVE
jgi:hypothetical protein